jgi:hypothetical protein
MKGQTQAVTAVLITSVIVTAVISAYSVGLPLIEDSRNEARLESVESKVVEIGRTAMGVAESSDGVTRSVRIDADDVEVFLNESGDYIDIGTNVGGERYPRDSWQFLIGDSRKNLSFGDDSIGTKGEERPGIVAATSLSGSSTRYRMEFRSLNKSSVASNSISQVDLRASGSSSISGAATVTFSHNGTELETGDNAIEINGTRYARELTILEVRIR